MSNAERHSDKGYGTHPSFKTRWRHRKLGYFLHRNRTRPEGLRRAPECVVLPGEGVGDERPPVRIFLGTEPNQFRAERIFLWSIDQVRDKTRRYEIYMMKDLEGFDRRGWKTGFTNYRYAIPALVGYEGRGIYNDVDQIYLGDPAELFDSDMKGKGVLGINERETSVMLIDCARMADIWRFEDAAHGGKHKFFRAKMHDNSLWGPMPGIWNARDWEYKAGQSKLLHYTTLQTQPWQPFPKELRYHESPEGKIWFDMERAADVAGYTVFKEESPSQRYKDLLEMYRTMHQEGVENRGHAPEKTFYGKSLADHIKQIGRLIEEGGAKSLLDFGAGKGMLYETFPGEEAGGRFKRMAAWGECKVTCYDPGYEPFAQPYEGKFDGVISTDVLEHIPDDDIPWVLDKLFSASGGFVYAVAATYPAKKLMPNGENAHCTLESAEWWNGQLAAASRRNSGVKWTLCVQPSRHLRSSDIYTSG